jgi:hypothetical protein
MTTNKAARRKEFAAAQRAAILRAIQPASQTDIEAATSDHSRVEPDHAWTSGPADLPAGAGYCERAEQ